MTQTIFPKADFTLKSSKFHIYFISIIIVVIQYLTLRECDTDVQEILSNNFFKHRSMLNT